MAHKPNPTHLHGGDYSATTRGSSSHNNTRASHQPTIMHTARFSAFEINVVQQRDGDEDEVELFDENFGDVDDDVYDHYSTEADDPLLGVEKSQLSPQELFEQELERRVLEEQLEEHTFREDFLSDVQKPVLDSGYKYPTISVMVINSNLLSTFLIDLICVVSDQSKRRCGYYHVERPVKPSCAL